MCGPSTTANHQPGPRTENESVPSFSADPSIPSTAIEWSFGDKLAPRAGFAYDLKGDGKTKLNGSWGIFYDIFKLELPLGSFGGQKWLEHYDTLDTPDGRRWIRLAARRPARARSSGRQWTSAIRATTRRRTRSIRT